ncbi:MAG: hypothetical protein EBU66_20270 [Bacteroidetes bacterium]|nr:hypothetical protein [Bacteroidota bacterium]
MLTPNLQPTLFTTQTEEALQKANTSESIATLWFQQQYVSFDISKVSELQHHEVLELTFVSKLFQSTLGIDVINQLLETLPKPYAYEYHRVFYNVFSGEWDSLPVEIDEDEIIEDYFDSLDPEHDRETIEGIITKLQALLEEGE